MNKPKISLFWTQIDADKPSAVYIQAQYQTGGVVAQLRLDVNDKAGWVAALFVSEQHRNAGLASLLLGCAFCICKRRGFESVGLTVAHKNEGAKRLYKKLGFLEYRDGYEGYQELVKPLI